MSKDRPRAPDGLEVLLADDEAILTFPLPEGESSSLTIAESSIVLEILAGRSNAEIAASRGRSVRTIANQVASILRKVGARSRVELAARMALVCGRK